MHAITRLLLATLLAAVVAGPRLDAAAPPYATAATAALPAPAMPDQTGLTVAQAFEPAEVHAGGPVTITLTVTNHGPAEALSTILWEHLPAGVCFRTPRTGCASGGPQSLGTMAVGESRAVVLPARVPADAVPGSVLMNEAAVSWWPGEGETQVVFDTAGFAVVGLADLTVAQYGEPDVPLAPGGVLTRTFAVDNLGPGDGHAVALAAELDLDGPLTLVAIDSDRPADCTPQVGAEGEPLGIGCLLEGPLPPFERWAVTVAVGSEAGGAVASAVTVAGSDADPDTDNNRWGAKVLDGTPVDVGLMATGPETALAVTETYAYTLRVTDHGPTPAAGVWLVATLAPWVVLGDVTAESHLMACSLGGPGKPPNRLTCSLDLPEPYTSLAVDIGFTLAGDVPPMEYLFTELTITSDGLDMDVADNRAGIETKAIVETDLVVAITQTPRYVRPGSAIAWDVTVRNDGPCDALGATVEDVLQVGVAGAAWTCTPSDEAACPASGAGAVLRERVDLPAGSSLTYRIEAVRTPAGAGRTLYNTVWAVPVPGALDYVDDNHATAENVEYGVFLPLAGR